jgi:uncharacterized protein (UPF0305 family)
MEVKGLRIPDGYEQYETVMSNCSGEINVEVAEYIKDKPLHSQYSGWNFCSQVWRQDDKWCCEVWTYMSY